MRCNHLDLLECKPELGANRVNPFSISDPNPQNTGESRPYAPSNPTGQPKSLMCKRGTTTAHLTVGLLPGDALDVDNELAAVAGLHLALAVLVGPSDHHHLVTLSHGERSDLGK